MPIFQTFKARLCAALILTLCAMAPAPALAARSTGDMFADADWCCGNRPRVPSDSVRGADMFKKVPLAYNRNADLFDSLRVRRIASRADMLAPRRQAPPVGPLFDNTHSDLR